MKYFKLEELNNGTSIWQVKPDGTERCIYHFGDNIDSYVPEYGDWTDPATSLDIPIPEIDCSTRICKNDIFIEAI